MERGDYTPLAWRVEHVLVDGGFGFLYGKKGSLKTFTALDLAERVARGWDWRGHSTEQGPVLYVAAEDYAGVNLRHEVWLKHYSEPDLDLLEFIRSPVNLMDPDSVDELAAYVKERQHKLVIFDTLHRSMGFGAGSEMSDTDTAKITGVTDTLRQAYYADPECVPLDPDTQREEHVSQLEPFRTFAEDGGTVDPRPWTEQELGVGSRYLYERFRWWSGQPATVFVHHPNQRTNTLRGFGGFYGDSDMILRMTRRRDGTSAMYAEKVKNWDDGWTIRYTLEKVGDSCVVVDGSSGNPNDERILQALEEQPGQTHGELADSTGIAKQTLSNRLRRLAEAGDVEQDDDRRWWPC